jgi:hypothetical protein
LNRYTEPLVNRQENIRRHTRYSGRDRRSGYDSWNGLLLKYSYRTIDNLNKIKEHLKENIKYMVQN